MKSKQLTLDYYVTYNTKLFNKSEKKYSKKLLSNDDYKKLNLILKETKIIIKKYEKVSKQLKSKIIDIQKNYGKLYDVNNIKYKYGRRQKLSEHDQHIFDMYIIKQCKYKFKLFKIKEKLQYFYMILTICYNRNIKTIIEYNNLDLLYLHNIIQNIKNLFSLFPHQIRPHFKARENELNEIQNLLNEN